MSLCSYPPFRLTRQKIVTHLFATAPCNRFLFTSTFESTPRSMITKSRLSCIRQLHIRHPNAPSTLPEYSSKRATFTLLPHTGRSIWKFAFMQQLRWRKPPEDDEAVRQNEEEAAKEAILEKAFESRQPADLMLRCELLSTIPLWCLSLISLHILGTILDEAGVPIQSHLRATRTSDSHLFSHPGNVKTISGTFKKSDLCMQHHLNVSTQI